MHQIGRWYKMLSGKSVWHVNQDLGKCFKIGDVYGYYNNMTEKVTKMPELLDTDELPRLDLAGGSFTVFPVAIFQYGLGAYDLYLQTKDDRYLRKFQQCVDWTVKNQDERGRWNNFSHYKPESPFSAMAQGEAVSLLCRAYKQSGDKKYLYIAKTAIDYMLLPIEQGGATDYSNGDVVLMEYTFKEPVMNGWIFAWWGLYDYCLLVEDEKVNEARDNSLDTLIKYLPKFNNSIWSIYDLAGKVASPFYHHLHIAQMQAMYRLTEREEFNKYANLWQKRENSRLCYAISFVQKAIQKLFEKE